LFNTVVILTAFVLGGFDRQELNLAFVKTNFHVLKIKFYACIFRFRYSFIC